MLYWIAIASVAVSAYIGWSQFHGKATLVQLTKRLCLILCGVGLYVVTCLAASNAIDNSNPGWPGFIVFLGLGFLFCSFAIVPALAGQTVGHLLAIFFRVAKRRR